MASFPEMPRTFDAPHAPCMCEWCRWRRAVLAFTIDERTRIIDENMEQNRRVLDEITARSA